ncbi:uncharacterized protein B0I36DRAFT_323383 [Microdochium trichocladiopsis]|uniref:Secreted protein n=1 Tax=Microdochium trichocladiopsis TaxID=1682393 RepID=A0A9P8Y7L6_9PEZI|nr:uncharacterized protein B0I36DRAFT_323383 [Microdochium trichocladiopsis]KAH7031193.1 hypothetical protein B0I36DRAFT_323383 [Microdochium trichocladiopsis]
MHPWLRMARHGWLAGVILVQCRCTVRLPGNIWVQVSRPGSRLGIVAALAQTHLPQSRAGRDAFVRSESKVPKGRTGPSEISGS